MTVPEPFTTPDPQAVADSRIMDFARHAGMAGSDYAALHRWSVTDLEGFWGAVWEYLDIDADTPFERVLAEERMVVNPAAVDAPDLIDHYARLGAERRGRWT
ncbi:acetyl-coenzyme A synthetase N-terminal domain-containing protein [Streptomyces sp. NPDC058731]|uniref:acetyl-coenzyme A synthetase N-terminal domain-containing protein n=1 Tax=Streptomyces sp. NPDC058731 TaxID=3346613 RepID=UPI0036B9E590